MDINAIKQNAKKVFANYTSNYDMSDPKINLKAVHTYKVAEYCEQIARSLELGEEDVLVAWMCGMLHDIGRFEQVTRYNTFIDSLSVDHAKLSCEILWGDGEGSCSIRNFMPEDSYDELIKTAIFWHSAYRYREDMDERTKMFCDILRDADKLDIWRVNLETPLSDIHNIPMEEFYISEITPEVEEAFYNHTCILRALKKTAVDNVVGYMSLYWELVYPISQKLAKSEGWLGKIAGFESKNEATNAKLARMRTELNL